MDAVIIFLVVVVLLGLSIFIVIAFSKRGKSYLDKQKYQSRWLAIESSLNQAESSSYHLAVLNADKLLDMALKERGFKGATMGERMKAANKSWKNANAVWTAHKVRNKIAHEPDVSLSYELARRSLASFRDGLKDMGAI